MSSEAELLLRIMNASQGSVDLMRLVLTRANIDRIRADMMTGHRDDHKIQCNFDGLELYLNRCDQQCELWAAKHRGVFRGFMLVRHGLKTDIRWNPTPGSNALFTGFIPQVDGFDNKRVIDILMLCSHGGPQGMGQLLVLVALALSSHGTFLQLSIRMEEHRVTDSELTHEEKFGPPLAREGDKYLVIRHKFMEVAQHIYTKFGFHQVDVRDNAGYHVGGVFYYRPERLTRAELDKYLDHLRKYDNLIRVDMDRIRRDDQDAPDILPPGMLSGGMDNAPVVQPLGGLFGGDPDAPPASPLLSVYGLGGGDDDIAFPGAGQSLVEGSLVGSEQRLVQYEPLLMPTEPGQHQPSLFDEDFNYAAQFVDFPEVPEIVPPKPNKPQKPPKAPKPPKKKPVAPPSDDDEEDYAEKKEKPRKSTTCDICHHRFTNRQNLLRHVKYIHNQGIQPISRGRHRQASAQLGPRGQIRLNRCPICGKTFPGRPDNLRRHDREVHHPPEKEARRIERRQERCAEDEDCEYKCLTCGSIFTNQQNLIRHKKSIHGQHGRSRRSRRKSSR